MLTHTGTATEDGWSKLPEIEIPGLCTVRHLNCQDIMRLRQMHGPNRAIAPYAFATGMTIKQFKKLPPEARQDIVFAVHVALLPPEQMGSIFATALFGSAIKHELVRARSHVGRGLLLVGVLVA